jgi:hypothetical protein
VANSQSIANGVPTVDDATDPVGEPENQDASTDPVGHRNHDDAPTDAPQPEGAHPESIEAADEQEGCRPFFVRIGGRAVVLPLACVAALLVGFGSVTAVLAHRPAGATGYTAGAYDGAARRAVPRHHDATNQRGNS